MSTTSKGDETRRPRRATWRTSVAAVVLGALAAGVVGCGGDSTTAKDPTAATTSADVASPSEATSSPTQDSAPAPVADPVQLDVDPCSLLTPAEMNTAIGSEVEQGGFGEDLPGRCTYSVGGDVGAGVVAISLEDPLVCAALKRALDSGVSGQSAVVDVGQGGVVGQGGTIDFLVNGGCVGITGSVHGESLSPDILVTLAMAAAGRVG